MTTIAKAIIAALLLVAPIHPRPQACVFDRGMAVRGDAARKTLALAFTADSHWDSAEEILKVLEVRRIRASFFLTGRGVRSGKNGVTTANICRGGHYVGPHSDTHELLVDWKTHRTRVSRAWFLEDLQANIRTLAAAGCSEQSIRWWIPPFEHANAEVAGWAAAAGRPLANYTRGTLSHTDYTTKRDRNYVSSKAILRSLRRRLGRGGFSGHIVLFHLGAGPERPDPFALLLPVFLDELRAAGYSFVTVPELLEPCGAPLLALGSAEVSHSSPRSPTVSLCLGVSFPATRGHQSIVDRFGFFNAPRLHPGMAVDRSQNHALLEFCIVPANPSIQGRFSRAQVAAEAGDQICVVNCSREGIAFSLTATKGIHERAEGSGSAVDLVGVVAERLEKFGSLSSVLANQPLVFCAQNLADQLPRGDLPDRTDAS